MYRHHQSTKCMYIHQRHPCLAYILFHTPKPPPSHKPSNASQFRACVSNSIRLHRTCRQQIIRIGRLIERAQRSLIRPNPKIIAPSNGIPILGNQWIIGKFENVIFHKDLCSFARADAVSEIVVVGVENVHFAATYHGPARVDRVPVIVSECNKEMTAVFRAVGVRVANDGTFPCVVEAGLVSSSE